MPFPLKGLKMNTEQKNGLPALPIPSRELDALVAEKVMGIKTDDPPAYSSDLNLTWLMEQEIGRSHERIK